MQPVRDGKDRDQGPGGRVPLAVADAAKKIAVRGKACQGREGEADKRRMGLADPGDGKN